MIQSRSLRQLLTVGTAAFVVGVAVVLAGFIMLFTTLRRDFDRDLRASVVEQRTADEIMTSVYGQLLASYRQLQSPSSSNRERFDSLGQIAYTRLREYLHQPMAFEPRLQVETIKELHETLEVEAHQAFDLILRGEPAAARTHIGEMETRAGRLEAEMDHFVALRDHERSQQHDAQVAVLRRWVFGLAVLIGLLAVHSMLFLRAVRAHVVRPLAQIADVANRLGAGELSARIPAQRHEELAAVAASFNEMARHVQTSRAEVEAQNRELSGALHDLQEAQQSLVQQEKMSAVGTLLAGLAHELNNPLAGILGSAQIVEDELSRSTDPAVQRTVNDIVRPLVIEAERAGKLVRNLLQFSRKANVDGHAVDIKSAIDVAAGLRRFAFTQAGKTLQIEVPGDLYVEADAQRMEHVAMNLMSNSLDAMQGGTGTSLVVRAEAAEPGWMTITFSDDGPGFRDPERVFDPFYSTKVAGTGTGLGLTLVHRFVTEVAGTVHATNAAPHGARIVIRLPSVSAPPLSAVACTESRPRASRPMVTIAEPPLPADQAVLVVDDEPALRNIQRRFLAKVGVRVVVASSGAEAKAMLEHEHFDAVVTDIRMPGEMDGIALYEWLVVTQPEMAQRCLFVSGDLADRLEGSALQSLRGRLISKPFTRDEYVARVQAVLDLPHLATSLK